MTLFRRAEKYCSKLNIELFIILYVMAAFLVELNAFSTNDSIQSQLKIVLALELYIQY